VVSVSPTALNSLKVFLLLLNYVLKWEQNFPFFIFWSRLSDIRISEGLQ
jgi:hypothetical protein